MDRNRNGSRKTWFIIGAIAVALTVLVSYLAFNRPAMSYKKEKARTGDIITYYSFSGNVYTKNRQSVYSDKIMQISEINIEKGQEIKEGDILFITSEGEEIKSEIDGEAVLVNAEENKPVAPGTLLAEIVDYSSLEIIFKADEFDVGVLEEGKEATVYIPAVNKEITGKIREISKEGQIANGVTFYTASIDIEPDGKILAGMSAEVRLVSDKAENIIILPMDVIQFDEQNQPYILKKGDGNSVIKQIITTGINDGIYVEIKSGVSDGEEILYRNDTDIESLLFPEGGKNTKFYPGGNKK